MPTAGPDRLRALALAGTLAALLLAAAWPAAAETAAPAPVAAEPVAAEPLATEPLATEPEAPPVIAPNASTFTLDNGLEVVVIPDHRAPVVTQMVWYKAGSADEQRGKTGIAHFLEHLMFKGTANHPEGEFKAVVAELGGSQNAFTATDYTAYHQTIATQHLRTMMEFESDRMANLVLSAPSVESEREVIIEERRMRIDNDPASQLGEAANAALFQNHPYGMPIIGWPAEMAGLTREDAVAWYDRYYTPNNAILILAGDVDEATARTLAEETYGRIARRAEPPPRIRAEEPPALTPRIVTMSDPRVTQPSISRRYLAASYTQSAEESLALQVLSDIIGGGTSSRFYKQLVTGQAIATSAGAGYGGTAIDDGVFYVYGVPRGATDIDQLMDAIDVILDDIRTNGVTEEEVALAKEHVVAGAVYAQDSLTGLANVFGAALATGQTMADVQDWAANIDKVTAAEVQAVAAKYLDARRSVTARLVGPQERQ